MTDRRAIRFALLAAAVTALGLESAAFALTPTTALSQYGHDVWDSDSGLPQNSVDAIVQTRDGYLWLGTQEGLIRFDGVRFTIFDTRNSPQMKDDWVRSLCETRDGTLWVGTTEGLLAMKQGRFDPHQPDGPLATSVIRALFEGRDGSLWIGSDVGVFRFRAGRMTLVAQEEGLPDQRVLAIGEDSSGAVWVSLRTRIARFDGARFVPQSIFSDSPAVGLSFRADPDGGIWIGTGKGLVHWADGKTRLFGSAEGLSDAAVKTLYRDREGMLWAGTARGLFRYENGRFSGLTREKGGLSSFDIAAIWEDKEGSLWLGTADGGLNRLKDERIANYTTRQGLPDDRVWSVFEDRSKNIWVGTVDGGLSLLTPGAAAFELVANLGAAVLSMDQDLDGDLWVGTRGNGVSRIRGREVRRLTKEDGLPATWILSICADRRGGVWFGSSATGAYLYRDGKFTHYTDHEGLTSNIVFSIFQDSQDVVWIGTFGGGLSRFEKGRFQSITTKDGLAHNIVLSILEEGPGAFWFGTRGGLSRFSAGKFTTYRQSAGLFHDAIQKVLADDQGYLWLTSNRGIFRVRSAELAAVRQGGARVVHPIGFTTANGMRSVECNNGQHGGFRGRDGRLWFATLKGLAMADPSRIRLNAVAPKVVIESVSSGRKTLDSVAEIALPPSLRDLEFHYTALSFRNPAAIRFRYRLDGFDRTWIEAGSRRVAYYTNLPPGAYRFRVLAANEDGVWSPKGAVSEVRLERSLPETTWFRLCGLVAAAFAVWTAHRFRVRRLAAREALRAAVFEAKLSSLQAQLQPHFLFNALNSLLPLVGSDPGRARRMIVRIGDLLREGLLAETTSLVTLERDLALLNMYLDVERMRFRDRIQVEVDADPRARFSRVPSFLLQPLVENAIKHAADPRTGRVRIRIEARAAERTLSMRIRDDGPGMPDDPDVLKFGIGLRNIQRRLEALFPGEHVFRLTNPEGGGCEVFVSIPLSFETGADPRLSAAEEAAPHAYSRLG